MAASDLIASVRRAKSAAGLSMRADASSLTAPCTAGSLRYAEEVRTDLAAAAHVEALTFVAAG